MVVESNAVGEVDTAGALQHPYDLPIPATLQDSLMARLDRLPEAKEIAQVGATLGREFEHRLIQAVSALDDTEVHASLTQLVDAGLLFQRDHPPDAHYSFKHALVQDAAYQSLLRSRRQALHRTAALTLDEQFADIAATQPELLAQHYTEAGLTREAVTHWLRAGVLAGQRANHVEAIKHYRRGLEL